MSFILEALKKVDKKHDHTQDGVVMQGGRRWGDTHFPWGLTAVVVVAIAALALATLAFFRSPPADGGIDPSRAPSAASAVQAPPSAIVPENVASPEGADEMERAPARDTEPAAPVARTERITTHEVNGATPTEEEAEATDEAEQVAAAPPVRLVGRTSDASVAAEFGDGTDEELPSGLPPLILQGTSVIDGKPIAVVNYQRLFEGDSIEGARVVKILDRAVELEFEGTRFTIRL